MEKAIKVNPIVLEDPESGEKYTLEFSRESVKFAEQRGFKISELTDFPHLNIPALFYYAFRMHHPNIGRNQAEKMLEALGGLLPEELGRLVDLYNQPSTSLIITTEGGRKNARMTMSL